MRIIKMTIASLLALSTPALADTSRNYSAMIAANGLSQTADALAALPEPSPSDHFALGGVQFLRTVERTLQTRYTYGITGEISDLLDVPLLRLPIFDNPDQRPFTPDVIETLLLEAVTDFDGALSALDTIGDTDDVAVTINTEDLWFDVNINGSRDAGEGMFELLGADLDRTLDQDIHITVQFDTADAAWLSAYAHLLSGVSETILAFDPAEAIQTVMTGTAQLQSIRPDTFSRGMFFSAQDELFADAIAIAIRAIEGQPDVMRSRAAHAHFLSMIADNKVFWTRVAQETDNTAEWIPNKHQSSALPITFPADTGQRWQAVLSDAEALLKGDLLLPHWRLDNGSGLNLAKLMQDPPVLDVVGIIQGHTVAPYAQNGRRIDSNNLWAFEQLVGGDAPLFMVILN